MESIVEDKRPETAPVCFRNNRIWFTKEAERRVTFIMTLLMLIAGILYKTGVW